jgi:hypothetical protein
VFLKPETKIYKSPGRHKEFQIMPSKDKIKKLNDPKINTTRPFVIFYVNAKAPKEVLTDTIMARNCGDAQDIAAIKHMTTSILYVRGIGDSEPNCNKRAPNSVREPNYTQFPCARFIKGKFLQATFTDDTILESLSDQA